MHILRIDPGRSSRRISNARLKSHVCAYCFRTPIAFPVECYIGQEATHFLRLLKHIAEGLNAGEAARVRYRRFVFGLN